MSRPAVRVIAVTQSDPFFTGAFFSAFLKELETQPVELVEIVLLPNFGESKRALAARLLRLYGAVDFARLAGRYVIARARDRRGPPRTVETIAKRHGVSLRRLDSINSPDALEDLERQDVDVLLSVAAPEIFGERALAAAPLVLNVHSGKLPEYRGMMPTFWALVNREEDVVVTVHEMAEKVDAGNVLAEFPVAVERNESAFELGTRAKRVAGREVARLLGRVGTDAWPESRRVTNGAGHYYRFPTRADVKTLRSQGVRML
jgi:methionyl-tRNA formyltransferase